jgi:hypothetical protein
MTKPSIEDFMFKKNPSGPSYNTGIDGTFSCMECDEVVKKASWAERTGELTWKCSQGHVSKANL